MRYFIIFFALGIMGLLHQYFICRAGWLNWSQFWCHESLIAICFVLAFGSLGRYFWIRFLRK